MKPIRKTFDPKSLFPFQIVYRDKKSPQKELPNHIHDWFEIVHVYSGKGTFFIDNSIQQMEKGDLFILPGNTIHRAIPDDHDPVTSTALFFNPLLVQHRNLGDTFSFLEIFEKSIRSRNYRYSLSKQQHYETESYLEYIQNEITLQEFGYKQSVLTLLQMLLLFVNRSFIHQQTTTKPVNKSIPNWLEDILDYIEKNYANTISLDTLASHGNVSTAHLSRVFKKMTGLNISEYISTKKVLMAKDLLLTTDENISTIANKCGFESMPHFYRTFKKLIGMTPTHYRKHGNNIKTLGDKSLETHNFFD